MALEHVTQTVVHFSILGDLQDTRKSNCSANLRLTLTFYSEESFEGPLEKSQSLEDATQLLSKKVRDH